MLVHFLPNMSIRVASEVTLLEIPPCQTPMCGVAYSCSYALLVKGRKTSRDQSHCLLARATYTVEILQCACACSRGFAESLLVPNHADSRFTFTFESVDVHDEFSRFFPRTRRSSLTDGSSPDLYKKSFRHRTSL